MRADGDDPTGQHGGGHREHEPADQRHDERYRPIALGAVQTWR
jgi:hypothetical protein